MKESVLYIVCGSSKQLARIVTDESGNKKYQAYFPKDGVFDWYDDEVTEDYIMGDRDWWPVSEEKVPELMKREKEVRGK